MTQTLTLPVTGANIQEIDGVKYLVARLDEKLTCKEYIEKIKQGETVMVPVSKQCHLVGLLKRQSIFTRSKTLVPGQWVSFTPCAERPFKK